MLVGQVESGAKLPVKEGKYSIRVMRNVTTTWLHRKWGWNGVAVPFGIGHLHLGSVVLRITWPVIWPY